MNPAADPAGTESHPGWAVDVAWSAVCDTSHSRLLQKKISFHSEQKNFRRVATAPLIDISQWLYCHVLKRFIKLNGLPVCTQCALIFHLFSACAWANSACGDRRNLPLDYSWFLKLTISIFPLGPGQNFLNGVPVFHYFSILDPEQIVE